MDFFFKDSAVQINDQENSSTEMTLKQSESDTDQLAVDDLFVNDLPPPIVKLEKLANSENVFNRQLAARNLSETLRSVLGNEDEVARVINILCSLSEDYDPSVRSEITVKLPNIAAFCRESSLSNAVEQYLEPILINYLGDESALVRNFSHSSLLSFVEQRLVDSDTVTEKICPLVLHLTEIVHPEDLRTESVVLMSKLAALLGKKVAEEVFLDSLFSLCIDKSNNIRKACASTFGDFCTTVGREKTEEALLPKFFTLCKDSAWCVRKACAENFMPVSCVVSRETRCKELAPLYMSLLSDQSRWVRLTAYQALGPFISTFAEPEKTGLYYSKDGVLTVVEASCLQADHESSELQQSSLDGEDTKYNSSYEEESSTRSNDSFPSVDRTNSSATCDSVVPLNNADITPPASDAPSVLCHVDNNYCTVIQVNSTVTLPSASRESDEVFENNSTPVLPKENGLRCDGSEIVSENECSDDDKPVSVMHNCATTTNRKYRLEETGKGLNEEAFSKLWYEILYRVDDSLTVVNGDLTKEINGENNIRENSLDSSIVQNSEVESALLSSITVNGINISSSVALAGPMKCEVIPVVTCSASVNKSYLKDASLLNESNTQDQPQLVEIQHSMQQSTCSQTQDASNIAINEIVQESNCESTAELSTELKVADNETALDESAFNHFQYWRSPLPDIDVNAVCGDLQDSYNSSQDLFSGLEVNTDSNKSGCYDVGNNSSLHDCFVKTVNVNSGWFTCSDRSKTNDQILENKGEPPPGSKQISVHDQDIVPSELLLRYLSMIDAAWAQTIDAEIARHCAYSLPAVALTLGRQFWPCLRETFNALSSDLQGFIMMWKVRRTVASSMHQLAVILGPEITSMDLLPVFSRFINDLDEVRIGILQHMSEFLEVLRPEERREFLPSFSEFLVSNSDTDTNEKNWRFRLILAEQLVSVADLYEPQDVRDHLVPLTLTLIRDKICDVRRAAVRVMAAVMRRMSQSPTPDLTKAVLSELAEKFIHAPKWLHRQLYVYICQEFIVESSLPPDQFAEDALPQLLYLCWDRIPNVRIAIARCLAVVIWPLDTFSNPDSPHRELLLQTIHTLQSDADADVRFYANMVSTHECSCLQHGELTNFGELPV